MAHSMFPEVYCLGKYKRVVRKLAPFRAFVFVLFFIFLQTYFFQGVKILNIDSSRWHLIQLCNFIFCRWKTCFYPFVFLGKYGNSLFHKLIIL